MTDVFHVYIDVRIRKGMIAFLMLSLFSFFPACRTVTESDAVPMRETADVVSVVAVQYVVAALWPFSNFTDPSHFMV